MLLLFLACAGPQDLSLLLRFEAVVEGQPVSISDDQPFTNAAGEPFGVRRYRAFLSDLALVDDAGERWSSGELWYLDLEDPDLQQRTLLVPDEGRTWVALELVMGLPVELWEHEELVSPPESEMFWPDSLGGGFHNLKFEGRTTTPDGEGSTFALHAGPLDGVDYSVPVSLELGALVLEEGTSLAVVADLSRWMTDPHDIVLSDLPNGGVMDVAEVQVQLSENAHDVLTVELP